jgi:hypothetical protein
LVFTFVSGCTPVSLNGRAIFSPEFTQFKKIAILPPRIDVAEIGAGGVVEKMDEWSQTAIANVGKAIQAELARNRRIQVIDLSLQGVPDTLKSELHDTETLFDAVNGTVLLHVYGPPPHRFEEKLTLFNYSLGAETANLRIDDADALLLVKGIDQISSAGRKAFQTTAMLAAAAVGVVLIPQMGTTAISAALVDARTGHILWYNFDAAGGVYDLREPASAASFVSRLFSRFPTP